MKRIRHKLFFVTDCTNITRPVGLMNTCKAQAEEIILSELIYN